MDMETEAELSVVPRVRMLAESGGAQAGSSGIQESQIPCLAAELAPLSCQLCPQNSGRLSHESPHPHKHTQVVRSPQDGTELGPSLHL